MMIRDVDIWVNNWHMPDRFVATYPHSRRQSTYRRALGIHSLIQLLCEPLQFEYTGRHCKAILSKADLSEEETFHATLSK